MNIFSLEARSRQLSRLRHIDSVSTPESETSVSVDHHADAQGCEISPCPNGLYQLSPQVCYRIVQEAGSNHLTPGKGCNFIFHARHGRHGAINALGDGNYAEVCIP